MADPAKNREGFSSQKYLVLAVTCSFAPLSVDLIAPALPAIAQYFAVPLKNIQFSVFIFLAGYGIGPFFWGIAADRWGRTPAMMAGLLLYSVSSVLCAIADDITWFIAIRFVQGVAAAAGVIISRAILRDVFDTLNVTKAVSTLFLWMVLIPTLAPLAGGLMSHYLPWYFTLFFMGGVGAVTLFFFRAMFASLPAVVSSTKVPVGNFRSILTCRSFCLNALANMFVITIMVVFATNYSQQAGLHYQLSTHQLGYLLSLFNGSIAAGVYVARVLLGWVSIRSCLLLGGAFLLAGWLAFTVTINSDFSALLLVVFLVVACLGKGILMSLCAGQALVPFSSGAGAASACYTLIQSMGSTALAFGLASVFLQTINTLLIAVLVCAFLSFAAIALLPRDVA